MAPVTSTISTPSPGTYTTGPAQVPGTPTLVGTAVEQISITFTTGTNGSAVTYLINVEKDGGDVGYVQADGTIAAGEVWQTRATWTTIVNVVSLTGVHGYRFKAKARNEALVETAYSSFSVIMIPLLDLAYSPLSNTVSYEPTTGNTLASGLTTSGTSKTITFTYTLTNKSATTSRIVAEYSANNSDWFTATKGSGGDAITALTTSAGGTSHTYNWASCTDVGNSYANTIYFRITPYDSSPTGGDAAPVSSTTVAVDNRPVAITLAEFSGWTWDKDVTPEFIADMGEIQCGTALYFVVRIYNAAGTEIQTNSSAEITDGWFYEQNHTGAPGSAIRYSTTGWDTNWTACTWTGVSTAYTPPTLTGNRIRYIMQTSLATGQVYSAKIQAAEIKEELV